MNHRWSLLLLIGLLISACGRDEPDPESSGTQKKAERRMGSGNPPVPVPTSAPASREALFRKTVENLHELPDEELALGVEALLEKRDQHDPDILLTAIYDTVELRPSFIRLPILIELAHRDTGTTGLRTTALSELRACLGEDHGESWPDWALALTEHLSTREGFLPTNASPED